MLGKCQYIWEHLLHAVQAHSLFYNAVAVLRIRSNLRDSGWEQVQRTQAIRHDELVAIGQLGEDVLEETEIRSFLWVKAIVGIGDDLDGGLGLHGMAGGSGHGGSTLLLDLGDGAPLLGRRELGVEVDGRGDEVDVVLEVLRDVVAVTPDVRLARGRMFVTVVLGLEQLLGLRHGRLEFEPAHGLGLRDPLRRDP